MSEPHGHEAPSTGCLLKRFVCNLSRPRTWLALVAIETGIAVGWWKFRWFGVAFGLLATGLLLWDLLVGAPPCERRRRNQAPPPPGADGVDGS